MHNDIQYTIKSWILPRGDLHKFPVLSRVCCFHQIGEWSDFLLSIPCLTKMFATKVNLDDLDVWHCALTQTFEYCLRGWLLCFLLGQKLLPNAKCLNCCSTDCSWKHEQPDSKTNNYKQLFVIVIWSSWMRLKCYTMCYIICWIKISDTGESWQWQWDYAEFIYSRMYQFFRWHGVESQKVRGKLKGIINGTIPLHPHSGTSHLPSIEKSFVIQELYCQYMSIHSLQCTEMLFYPKPPMVHLYRYIKIYYQEI